MFRTIASLAIASAAALACTAIAAEAHSAKKAAPAPVAAGAEHPSSGYYRRTGPQVRGFVARRGGYSYTAEDTINTYGDSRTRFGSTNVYRNPALDRQTNSGPFDHGFFFDSGISPRGGDSPYQN